MRLAALVPSIPAQAVAQLEACGVRTDSDLLFTPLFDLFKRLPSDALDLQELARLCTVVTELAAAEPILASELLQTDAEASERDAELRVGDDRIDSLLHGLGGRRIIEISGDRSTGKSALALNIALNHILSRVNETAAWIDTSGDFSAGLAYDILSFSDCENPESVLGRLQVCLAFDVETLHVVLDELFDPLVGVRPKMVVIDAITPLLGPILSGVTSHGHAVTTDLMQRLRAIANEFQSTILVINNATLKQPYDATQKNVERKPALGPTFTFMSDTTLWLSRKVVEEREDGQVYYLEVSKSRTKTAGASSPFCISQGRLKDPKILANRVSQLCRDHV